MLVRVLIAAGYPAGVIAAWGFTSLLTDRDVIVEADAGPLLGPAMVLATSLVTAGWVLRARRTAGFAIAGGVASAYLSMLVIGGLGYFFTRGDATALLLFVARYATSPFVIGAAVLAGVAIVLVFASGAPRSFDRPDHRG